VIPALAVLAVTFVVMEPVTYLTHRFVMHGVGRRLHRSHHRRWGGRPDGESFFEANDAFPVVFAGATMVALAVGFNVDGWSVLVPVCAGATLYGAAYAFVHDAYVHQRVAVRWRSGALDRLAAAHALHHRFGGEPYGMLAPVVPRSVRERAGHGDPERSGERVPAVPRP
jgi:beta-carotene 3-hydroxylase